MKTLFHVSASACTRCVGESGEEGRGKMGTGREGEPFQIQNMLSGKKRRAAVGLKSRERARDVADRRRRRTHASTYILGGHSLRSSSEASMNFKGGLRRTHVVSLPIRRRRSSFAPSLFYRRSHVVKKQMKCTSNHLTLFPV